MKIDVDGQSGDRGEATPHRLGFGHRAIAVTEIIDRWLAPDHRYFKVKGEDGAVYILRHDVASDQWRLVMFDRGRTPGRGMNESGPPIGGAD